MPNKNEWNFATKVVSDIQESGHSNFTFLPDETSTLSPFEFKGVVVDDNNVRYEILSDEAILTFKQLMVVHKLEYEYDPIEHKLYFKKITKDK